MKPVLAITMGDPAGIGPEIAVKALERHGLHSCCRPVVVGDAGVIARAAAGLGSTLRIHAITDIAAARFRTDAIDVIDQRTITGELRLGEVSAAAGAAAYAAVVEAIGLTSRGAAAACVTNPINKEALRAAGIRFPGHTEIFAHHTGTTDYTMMLAEGDLRIVHVSTHVSLRQACDLATRPRVRSVIGLAHAACVRLGIPRPRIGVAGLNPHAGDGGLFGDEERLHIAPAVADARADGLQVDGPWPPDSFFSRVAGGAYDIAVAMYHDQGHIPVKLRGFCFDGASGRWTSVKGINITLGLPILRVSVDHGTAFDQAGRGTADETSLVAAITYAARLAG